MAERAWPEWTGDEAARRETAKRHIVRAYEAAAAQAAGQPLDGHDLVENPRKAMTFFINALAGLASEEEVGRLLGLTEDEVSAARHAWYDARVRALEEHPSRRARSPLRRRSWRPPVY
jgi:hypothetical protein